MGDVHSLTLFRYSSEARDAWLLIHVRTFIKHLYVLVVNMKYIRTVFHRFKFKNKYCCNNVSSKKNL